MPRLTVGRVTFAMGLVVAALRLLAPAPVQLFDLKVLDIRHVLRGALPAPPEIAIVGIDEASLAALGRWPWPRAQLGDLIEAIARADAAAIGLDIVFDQEDRSLDLGAVEAAVDAAPQRSAESLLAELRHAGDERLAGALRASNRAVLAFFFELDGPPSPTLAAEAARLPELSVRAMGGARVATAAPFVDGKRLHAPLPLFAEAAGAGHINFLPDPDGFYRRLPLAIRVGDRLLPALSLQLIRRVMGGAPATLFITPYEVTGLRVGGGALPIDSAGQLWLDYVGPPGTFATYSAADVLAGRVGADALAGRIVLIGFTASGFDDVATPFAPVAPGVELQATAIDNMIHDRALWRPWWSVPGEALVVLVSAALIGFMLRRLRILGGALAALGLALLYVGVSQMLFVHLHLIVGAIYPLGGMLLCVLGGSVFGALVEEREKNRVREQFRHYLNPEVTELLARDPERLRLGGERCEITVLFSDIRGFTSMSERLDPEVLGEFLNEYLGAMTDIVFRHGGLLDKYVGDAVMAFWGAPVAMPDHAARCCAAALDMQATLERLNEAWQERGLPRLAIGVGIHTGQAAVGNFGSSERFSYTAIGDTVNLASRLEGLNKQYGTGILISSETRRAVGDVFECREVGEAQVRGRSGRVGVFALVGRRADAALPAPPSDSAGATRS